MANPILKPLLLAAGALAVVASPAHAVLQIAAAVDGFPTFTCVDQNFACDLDHDVGQLTLNSQIIGGVQILGSTQTQTIATGPGTFNTLNTSSTQVINSTAAPLSITVAVGGTDFQGPVTSFFASGSGTVQNGIGSSATLEFWGDTANQQGADDPNDTPGALLASSGLIIATTPAFAFSFINSGPFVDPNLFSFTLWASGVLAPGGVLVNRGQTLIAEQVAVPEPSSLLLLGSALVGLGTLARKRRRMTTVAAT